MNTRSRALAAIVALLLVTLGAFVFWSDDAELNSPAAVTFEPIPPRALALPGAADVDETATNRVEVLPASVTPKSYSRSGANA